jgi:hypothetical protein
MAGAILHAEDDRETDAGTPPAPSDYYSVLLNVIAEASSDPARLRKLVYAMASHHIKPEAVLAAPIADAATGARTLFELEQALALERAIKRLEAQAMPFPGAPDPASRDPAHEEPAPPEPSERDVPSPVPGWLDPASRDPAPAPIFEQRIEIAPPGPSLLQSIAAAASSPRVGSLLRLGGAAAMGMALFLGISGWLHLVRPPAAYNTRVGTLPAPAAPSNLGETVGSAPPLPVAPALHPEWPFPLPARYGVYAGSDRQLIELETLPVEVPPPGVRVSAEITRPSRVAVPGDRLAFVVFRQDLAGGAPAAVAAHIVARVARAIAFVDLRARVTPLESTWRMRDKAYEFKVTPVEGNREMFVVQSDTVLPPGRYALVLDGHGYDFTVAGPITAPEQCLEQTRVVNGLLVTECPG